MVTANGYSHFSFGLIPGSTKSREGASDLIFSGWGDLPSPSGEEILVIFLAEFQGECAKGPLVWDYELIFQGYTEV